MFTQPTHTMKKTKVGSIIQINPNNHLNLNFAGKLALVTEVKSWGVLADVPSSPGVDGVYCTRLPWNEFAYVGEASWPDEVC